MPSPGSPAASPGSGVGEQLLGRRRVLVHLAAVVIDRRGAGRVASGFGGLRLCRGRSRTRLLGGGFVSPAAGGQTSGQQWHGDESPDDPGLRLMTVWSIV